MSYTESIHYIFTKKKYSEIDLQSISSLIKTGVELKKDDEFYLNIDGDQEESLVEENLDRILGDKKPKILSVRLGHHQVAGCLVSLSVFDDHIKLKFNMSQIFNINYKQLADCDHENITKKGNRWKPLVKDFVLIARAILNSPIDYSGDKKK